MKAYLINMHLLVPRSRSSAKVKVRYKGYISQKNGRFRGICVSQTHLVQHYFSYIVAGSPPIHVFLEFFLLVPVLCSVFFSNHWLLSFITIIETVVTGKGGMNAVTLTVVSPQEKYWPDQGSNQ